MAITIKSAPQASGFVSANEDVWHVVDSTNKDIIGFKYIFDIYKGVDLLTRVTNSPYGDDGYGVINVGNIVRSGFTVDTIGDLNLTTSYTSGTTVINQSTDFWFTNYVINYGEICGVTNAGAPNVLADLASGTYRVYNTYNRHPIHGYSPSGMPLILSNRPNESNFYDGQPVVISINSEPLKFYVISDYEFYVNNTLAFDKQPEPGIDYFSLNGLSGDCTLTIKSDDVLDTTIYGSRILKRRCSKYKPYTLIFLNTYGAWDSFTFVNGNILTDNEKKRFEQMEWRLNGFNMVNKNGKVRYEGMRTYGGDFKTKMKLTTDLLSTEEYKWLFELIVSPLVYLWDKDSSLLHPVQITDTNYEMKNSLQNKSEFLEVNIDVYKQNTQYR